MAVSKGVQLFAFITATVFFFNLPASLLAEETSSIAEDNKKTTLQILKKSCVYPRVSSDEVAQQFMACYDEAPGKDIFAKCQNEAFGRLFDSAKNFKLNCLKVYKLPSYAKCLSREFDAAGLDQDEAVHIINACQLPVFG